MSTKVKDHSSLNHTNQVSEGALRTPLPWDFGMQYLRMEMVLLPGMPATAMHVSLFKGFLPVVSEDEEESTMDASSLSPPQMGLFFHLVNAVIYAFFM
jgi:hypothetical protein